MRKTIQKPNGDFNNIKAGSNEFVVTSRGAILERKGAYNDHN